MFNRSIHFIIIALISFTLVLGLNNSSQAEIPRFFQSSNQERSTTLPWWDLNSSFPCGRFWCSAIHLQGINTFSPELTLAVPFIREDSTQQTRLEVESRSQLVQQTFSQIFNNIVQSHNRQDFLLPQKNWQFWLPNFPKPLHPLTPNFEIGFQNSLKVIFVPTQPKLNVSQQDIVTVTEIDARANSKSMEQLATDWRYNLQQSMSQRLWGHTFDTNYPGIRLVMLLAITVVTIFLIWLIHCLKIIFKNWLVILKHKQDKLTEYLTKNSKNFSESELIIDNKSPDSLLKKQTIISQKRNSIQLILRFFFWIQISILLLSLSLMSIAFMSSRFLYRLFLGQAIFLPLLWALISLVDKGLALIIEYSLNQWAQRSQRHNPLSNRYTLRVKTYSRALKSTNSFLLYIFGIYLTALFLGIDFNFYASAGAAAVILAFLSRNLVENMLNGALVLWYDSYAVGDIIDIEGNTGLVEDINLYAKLRCT